MAGESLSSIALDRLVDRLSEQIDEHTSVENRKIDGIEARLMVIEEMLRDAAKLATDASKAFPKNSDGEPDFAGHRAAHEAEIRAARAKEKFYVDVASEAAKRGVVWVLGLVVVLAWAGAMARLKGLL